MKRLVILLFLIEFSHAVEHDREAIAGQGLCKHRTFKKRPHSVSILEFGAVGDGKTLNTVALQNAVFYAKSFADKGGAQLYVPPGRWLTGSFNLTSHLTLFLANGATILGLEDFSRWEIEDPLPSYGRGIEAPRGRYRSLINGHDLTDVVITGNNGTIDGQGSVWWEAFISRSLDYSRPHLVEFVSSNDIIISNITFLNSPAWDIHPVYCSNVQIQNITAHSPPDSPLTSGIVPDSSEDLCIENSDISKGHDAIVLKSGWDEYGIAYGRPTTNVEIRDVKLQSFSGSGLAIGSEMSGGIFNIIAENVCVHDSLIGIELKTTKGRGGYIKDVVISKVKMENVRLAFEANGQYGSHPGKSFDPKLLPKVSGITFKDVLGENITFAGKFSGIDESPFTSISLSNITLSVTSEPSASWECSNVDGISEDVTPEPCPDLKTSFLSFSSSTFLVNPISESAHSMR